MSEGKLGTPLNKQQSMFLRSDAPSPIPPTIRKMQLDPNRNESAMSPVKLKRAPDTHNLDQSRAGSVATSVDQSVAQQRSAQGNDLRDELDRLRERTRILADPSISTSFKREDDSELFELFHS
ncbi:hypothetical protein OIV83_004177 [Microbotryomycetes sp. JL201]|nr:hypothetical protein OIV83_004177 [Microbotryomycetes sp. JL201]